MSKIVKLAVIRSDDNPCPFGLPIPSACQTVGNLIYKMANVEIMGPNSSEEEKDEIKKANQRLFIWAASDNTIGKCPFAEEIFETHESVECNWEKEEKRGSRASPFYYQHFNYNTTPDGIFAVPLGWYSDAAVDRGSYFQMYTNEDIGSVDDKLI